jgi:hypothetical protein
MASMTIVVHRMVRVAGANAAHDCCSLKNRWVRDIDVGDVVVLDDGEAVQEWILLHEGE